MILAYAFIGKLPDYSVTTVHQARLFFDGPIYFIISEITSPYVATLKEKYNVTVIPYYSVKDAHFNEVLDKNFNKFTITHWVPGREKLFIYAFERFFVLNNLMKQKGLTDVLFLELDNLIYDNPTKWLASFQTKQMGFMYDCVGRASSGICYIRSTDILDRFTAYCINRIEQHQEGYLEEMSTLYSFWESAKDDVMLLPTHWEDARYNMETYRHSGLFGGSVFDAAAIGIFLGGVDLCHSGGVLKTGTKWPFTEIDYTQYTYIWTSEGSECSEGSEGSDCKKRIPYVNGHRINNLHVHSKVLAPMLSAPLK
jgi:hypothetical protein